MKDLLSNFSESVSCSHLLSMGQIYQTVYKISLVSFTEALSSRNTPFVWVVLIVMNEVPYHHYWSAKAQGAFAVERMTR